MSNWSERYAYAVTRLLPEGQRREVAQELEGTIEDMAADRAKKGRPTEAEYKQVLRELGNPSHLAGKYGSTRRYLIGPGLYDSYVQLLKVLLSVVPGILAVVMLAVGIAEAEQTVMQTIIEAVGAGIVVGIHLAFWVTVIFAFMERGSITIDSPTGDDWTPDDLPELPKHPGRQISLYEPVTGAAFTAIFIAWVASSPLLHTKDGAPLLNPELWSFWLPAFFILAGLTLVHEVAQAKVDNWTMPLTVTNIVLGLGSMAFIIALVTTQQVINPEYLQAWNVAVQSPGFETAARWTIGATVATALAVYVWDMAQSVVLNRRLRQRHKP